VASVLRSRSGSCLAAGPGGRAGCRRVTSVLSAHAR
jgi:hypothetical protein